MGRKSELKSLFVISGGIFEKSRSRQAAKKDRLTLSFKLDLQTSKISIGWKTDMKISVIDIVDSLNGIYLVELWDLCLLGQVERGFH